MTITSHQRMTLANYLRDDDGTETPVVSPGQENYNRDYLAKYEEYLARAIPEYWIIEPVRSQVRVCCLEDNHYQQTTYGGPDRIISVSFPEFSLTAAEILQAGR